MKKQNWGLIQVLIFFTTWKSETKESKSGWGKNISLHHITQMNNNKFLIHLFFTSCSYWHIHLSLSHLLILPAICLSPSFILKNLQLSLPFKASSCSNSWLGCGLCACVCRPACLKLSPNYFYIYGADLLVHTWVFKCKCLSVWLSTSLRTCLCCVCVCGLRTTLVRTFCWSLYLQRAKWGQQRDLNHACVSGKSLDPGIHVSLLWRKDDLIF